MDNVDIGSCLPCSCLGDIVTSGTSAGRIDINDLSALLAAFGGPALTPCFDLNANGSSSGVIDISDLSALLARFGSSCE